MVIRQEYASPRQVLLLRKCPEGDPGPKSRPAPLAEHEARRSKLGSRNINNALCGGILAILTGLRRKVSASSGQIVTKPCFIANWTSKAVDLIPSSSIMVYLWKATVLGVIFRRRAISFIACPSASSCSTSRCRGLSSWGGFIAAGRRKVSTSPCVARGVTYDRPRDTSWIACSSSDAAEFFKR